MIFVDYPGLWIVVGVVTLSAIGLFFTFRAEAVRKAASWRWILGVLQYSALVLVFVVLWDPSRPVGQRDHVPNTILTFFDTSESMSVKDMGNLSRLNRAVELFHDVFGPGLADRPVYRIFGFDRSVYECDTVRSLSRWGAITNLRSAFDEIERSLPVSNASIPPKSGSGLVGAVLFTDGQADSKNLDSYRPINTGDFKIVIVGVGSENVVGDLSLRSIRAPGRVLIDTGYSAEVSVFAEALAGSEIRVELLEDGELIATQKYSVKNAGEEFTVTFPLAAPGIGGHTITARAVGPEGESNVTNNERSTIVECIADPRMKVLYYARMARFDAGKIREALSRDKKIDLDFRLDAVMAIEKRGGGSRDSRADFDSAMRGQRETSDYAQAMQLSANAAEFNEYDVIIMDFVGYQDLTEAQIETLYRFVTNRGGGLILVADDSVQRDVQLWGNAKARSLLPIEWSDVLSEPWTGKRGKAYVTTEGRNSFILTEADTTEFPAETASFFGTVSKKPGATSLLNLGEIPLICVHQVGRGSVCFVNILGFHQWYREDLDGGLLQRFFSRLTAYMKSLPGENAGIDLFAERNPEKPQNVEFSAFVYDSQFLPVDQATVLLELDGEAYRMDPAQDGRYRVAVSDVREEAVLAHVEAERAGTFLGEDTLATHLPFPTLEMDRIKRDREFLQKLAKKIGATYMDVSEVDSQILKMFPAKREVVRQSTVTSVWRRWSLFFVLCGILTTAWVIRRGIGLV
ncbi:MAG TPA: hypothetical protein PLG59_01065 [bacterium]|nr:hypothetical protein [bacterium]